MSDNSKKNKQKKRSNKLFKLVRRGFYAIFAVLLVFALHQAPSHQVTGSKTTEARSIWITNLGTAFLHHTTRLDENLHDLAVLNFNTIYPCVWNRGYTLYPSSVARKITGYFSDPILTFPFQDVLNSTVKQARRQGLTIVPWFEYGLMTPKSSNLVRLHPNWVTVTNTGESILKPHSQQSLAKLPQPLRNLAAEITGANIVWLNPFRPEVQQFLTDLIVEVVIKYDVDGIQLDDHFGLPVTLGYDRYTVQLYQQEHNGANPPQNPRAPSWVKWRSNKITQFMTKISEAVKTAKPNCIVSLSPNPADFAYREYLQDWSSWVRMGIVDEIVVQAYRNRPEDIEAILKQSSLQTSLKLVPTSIGLYSGSRRNPQSSDRIAAQVEIVRKYDYSGVAFFSWESTLGWFKKDASESVNKTFRQLFPQPSLSPLSPQPD